MLAGVNIRLMARNGSAKRGYHHGDLRNALIEAAALLAQTGGPQSVTVRAAARAVGVTPTAAYRHFAGHEELLRAAKECATTELAAAMRAELATMPETADRTRRALGNLAAIGRAYIHFAIAQPGLFRTAFSWEGSILDEEAVQDPDSPFRLLVESLDELVAVGFLPPELRPMTEVVVWSAVHGLSTLLDGPLREWPPNIRDEAIVRTMLIVARGFSSAELSAREEAALADVLRELRARSAGLPSVQRANSG